MTEGSGFWQEGQRAWERIARWCQDLTTGDTRKRNEGDHALQALTDIVALRRLLDQIEFEAIRAGRRQGRSWAEIATRLGITRQSAWERWQDVDEPERPPQPASGGARGPMVSDFVAEAAARLARRADPPTGPSDSTIRAAIEHRHRSTVVVPNVIGKSWNDAREVLARARLVGISPDPDGPPLAALSWPDAAGVVTDQSPESGAVVPPGSAVTLWVERGEGGAGVREPRRPKPDPRTARKMNDEPSDEAVG
jgi:hypothetical protein